jgi:hypothetical protein
MLIKRKARGLMPSRAARVRIPNISVIKRGNMLKAQLTPDSIGARAVEEHMLSIFRLLGASFTEGVVENVLGMQIRSCAEPVFKIQPGENLHFVGHSSFPYPLSVQVHTLHIGDGVIRVARGKPPPG